MQTNCDPLQLLAALPNGSVAVFDSELRYVYAKGRGLQDVGLEPESLVGRRLHEVFPADAAALVELPYRRAFAGESVVFGLHYFHRTYALSAAPLRQQDGVVEQIIVLSQDISSLGPVRRAAGSRDGEARGETEADDQERLIATVGHELRNPLGAMRAAVALIQHSSDSRTREHATDVIHRQLAVADTLIQDLAELSRARRGVIRLRFSECAVEELVQETTETLAHLAAPGRHRIVVESSLDQGLEIRADRQRMVQVLTNLLTNAIRYTPPGGNIVIRCQQSEDCVSLAVCDSGKGISPTNLDSIFELFHRGDDGDGHGGLGIGLWVAREIVLLHGGRIDVFSAGLGHGATFTVRLPCGLLVRDPAPAAL